MKWRRVTKPGASAKQLAWWNSDGFREMGRACCSRFNAQRRAKPRCEAIKRSDGQPCQNPVVAGRNRCRLHGGAVPSGKHWHKLTYGKASTPAGAAKFERKLADVDRRARKREKRLAAMTPEERARHEAWHRTHRPGSAGARAAAKDDAGRQRALRDMLETEPMQLTPEAAATVAEIETTLEAVRRRRAEVERALAQARQEREAANRISASDTDAGDLFA